MPFGSGMLTAFTSFSEKSCESSMLHPLSQPQIRFQGNGFKLISSFGRPNHGKATNGKVSVILTWWIPFESWLGYLSLELAVRSKFPSMALEHAWACQEGQARDN